MKPVRERAVCVTPKMDKSQYNTTKSTINKWAKEKIGNAAAQKIFLDPTLEQNFLGNLATIPKRQINTAVKHRLQTFHKNLNDEQVINFSRGLAKNLVYFTVLFCKFVFYL